MKVVIGADKGGFILKEAIASRLAERGIEFEDVGTISLDACRDFVSVAEAAAGIVSRGEAELGILLCGHGHGNNGKQIQRRQSRRGRESVRCGVRPQDKRREHTVHGRIHSRSNDGM